MMNSKIIALLEEMKENCLKADFYKDPKRNDKAEALNFAIFVVEKLDELTEQNSNQCSACAHFVPGDYGCVNGNGRCELANWIISETGSCSFFCVKGN